MEKKNIDELSDIELKALAYDFIVQLELYNNNLKFITQELSNRKNRQSIPINSQSNPTNFGSIETI